MNNMKNTIKPSQDKTVEKKKKFLFSKKDILGLVAKHAIGATPYHRPDNLEIVIDKLNDIITPFFKKDEEFEFMELDYEAIKEFVFKHTTAIPEFEAWNEPKIKSDSPWIGTSSRYHSIKPDYDFIDLHALARNVANDILFESMGGRSIPLILGKENVN